MNTTITHSSMGKFLACPRQWYLSDYRQLKKIKTPLDGPLPFGIRFHECMERWGKGEIESPVDAWNELMDADYMRATEAGYELDKLQKESKMGHAMLTNFEGWLEESGFFDKYEIVAVEKPMRTTIKTWVPEPVDIVFQGKSDLIAVNKGNGLYLVVDWKTSASLADDTLNVMAKSSQFPGYHKLGTLTYPDKDFEGALAIIARKVGHTATSKPPYYHALRVPVTHAVSEAYMRRLTTVAKLMVQATEALDEGMHPDDIVTFIPSQMNCKSCPFRAPCDLMASYPAGAEDMLAHEYEEHDPLARYASGQESESVFH